MTDEAIRRLEGALLDYLEGRLHPEATLGPDDPRLSTERMLELFDAQAGSRQLDFAARELRRQGAGFYTIGGSGHEGNAALAAALEPSDPALLHYRSGAFYLWRADRAGLDGRLDVLQGVAANRDEPIAGGRHKVFGRRELAISPQTSTIASHLPRALGLAFAIGHRRKVGLEAMNEDAIVCCTFGDASINHSTAQGTLNAAAHGAHRQLRLPLLFVCEDNGLGISVPTPRGWIAQFQERPSLAYFSGDGCDVVEAYRAASDAVAWVRSHRRPALLHLSVVRLLGHAGSDVELAYRSPAQIRAAEDRDPLLQTARRLVARGVPRAEIAKRYQAQRAAVTERATEASAGTGLSSAAEIMAPLSPRSPAAVATRATQSASEEARRGVFGDALPEHEAPLPLAGLLRHAIGELLAKHRELLVFGEDVGVKGGVYGVTRGLASQVGPARVFDTLLDEQTILGLALGLGQHGLLPMPEIQYLAYLHNAIDQLRGEAATLRFFSKGAYRNPMVLRVASFAYPHGFGGHFHNDNSIAAIRDIPGVVIAAPSRGDDAAAMLHTCAAAAEIDGEVCVFLEPIGLYRERDLYESGDGALCFTHQRVPEHVPIGSGRVHGDGEQLLLVSFGNGMRSSLRVARELEESGVAVRVLDLRWLSPLPIDDLRANAEACGRVLVVDETRRTGGVAEGVYAALIDAGFRGPMARVTSADSFVPLGPAARHVLPSEASIREAADRLLESR